MNAQIRYGLASLLAAVLLVAVAGVINSASESPMPAGVYLPYYLLMLLGIINFFAGIALLIVGLVRRPRDAQQPR